MNKQAKEIDEFRKATVKVLNPDIKQFESEAKELVTMIKDARTFVSDQVKNFEEEERERKREVALLLIEQTRNEIELNEKYLQMIEVKDEYMLAAANPTKVKKLIVENFKEVKAIQDAEQLKIDTVHIILDAHNERLTFKFEFEYFERHINDETSLQELSAIVNAAVNKRLADEQAELERIKKAQEEAVAKAKFEAELKAKQEAERVKLEEERKHKEELDRIEKEKQEALWRVEFEKRQAAEKIETEKRMAEQEAKELAAKVEADRLEAIRVVEAEKQEAIRLAEEARAKVIEEARLEAERLAPVVNNRQKVNTVVLEIKGNKNQLEALKAYMEEYNIEYTKV